MTRLPIQFLVLLTTAALVTSAFASPALAAPDAGSTYVVGDGESLSSIAITTGSDMDALMQANQITNPDLIVVGQVLTIRGSTPVPTAVPTPQTYSLSPGDTLWSVALQFGVSSDALLRANSQLSNPDQLQSGAILTIPQPGSDVPSSSASQTLIPVPTSTLAPAPDPTQDLPGTTSQNTVLVAYTLQPKQTLGLVATRFSTTVHDIALASGITDPDHVAAGIVLQVPVPGRSHTVVAGETLFGIASQEKIDLGSLIDANSLGNSSVIHIGQVLKIPATSQVDPAPAASATPVPENATPTPTPVATPVPTSHPTVSPTPTTVAVSTATTPQTPALPPTPLATRAPAATVPPNAPTSGLAGAALHLLGAPYIWGGSAPGGFDCSGLVWYVAGQSGAHISRGMLGQYNAGSHPAKSDLKAGDIVFFQNTYTTGLSHNGIYIGNGAFVHAANESSGVTISNLSTAYWTAHWFGATRLN